MISTIDTLWVLLGAALVFFMQAGFAMVETGFTRAKNAGNIMMKNLMDFCFGTVVYWLLGFGLMFGTSSIMNGFIGTFDFLITGDYTSNVPTFTTIIFQTVFCATSATIVSGAMAERTKFKSYLIYSIIISAVVYPISGHWIWGGGWLSELGFHDFAGSTAVHMVGGISALIGAAFLGPRIGKYDKDGKPRAIPGHSITLGALGVFILWFGWFGFNPASTLGLEGQEEIASRVFVTTNLAAACATITAMITTWIRYKKPDVSMTFNGSLAGLVAITAGCATVSVVGSAIIGALAGILVVFAVEFFDKVVKVDDPVGAVSVHGVCGMFGTIMTGVFSQFSPNGVFGDNAGLVYGGGFKFLGVQCLGVISVAAWVGVTMTLVFFVIKKTVGLRVSAKEELAGLDIEEHGLVSAYADFMPLYSSADAGTGFTTVKDTGEVPIDSAIPVQLMTPAPGTAPLNTVASDSSIPKMSKVSILIRQSKFDELKDSMQNIGITGMTVTNVLGCGAQKGKPEYYRGAPLDITLLPKLQVDIVVCKVPVSMVIDTAKKVLYTGHIGDGKIFVYNVEKAVKVRTGEENYDALQDVE